MPNPADRGQQPGGGQVDAAAILASALDAIVVIGADNVIREFNPAAEAIFGWARADAVGQDLGLIIPPEMRERHRAGLDTHLRTGMSTVLDRRIELEAVRADGTRVPIEVSVSRMGAAGAPLFVAFIRDISARQANALRLVEHSRRLRGLAESQRELAGLSVQPEELYDRVARMALRAFDAAGAAFEVQDGDALVYRAAAGLAEGAQGLRIPREASLSGLSLSSGRSLVCVDADDDPRVDVAACRRVGLRSMVVGTLAGNDGPIGVVKVMAREPGRFSDDDIAVMDVFVGSLAVALDRLRRQQARDQADELRTRILRIQQALAASAEPLSEVMRILSEQARAITGADGAVVELLEGEDMVYAATCGSLAGRDGLRLRRTGSLSGLCASQLQLMACADAAQDPRVDAEACRALGVRSMVVAPLLGIDSAVGVLKVVSARAEAFLPAHQEALDALVHSMGLVIQRRAAAERIAASERRYRMLFAHNPHPMWVFDMDTLRFLEVNAAAVELYGYSREEFLARTILDIRPPQTREERDRFLGRLATLSGPSRNFPSQHQRRDGQRIDVEMSGDDLPFDGHRARLVLAHDVTARRQAERDRERAEQERERTFLELQFAAAHDVLTGLPRYATLQPWLESRIARGEAVAVLLVELDRFAALNQTLSHDVADDVLRQVGQRLAGLSDRDVQVCHLAGDEFVVLAPAAQPRRVAEVADELRARVAAPLDAGGFRVNLTATVGIAVSPAHGDNGAELLRRAEAAAERGKAAGRDCVYWFSAEAMQVLEDRITLGAYLRGAAERGELRLVYQPLLRGRGGRPVGFEALLRWDHPDLGPVSPARFIPVAESLGLMSEIGSWVVRAACQQLRAWLDDGLEGFRLAVNVSSLQLQRPGLVTTVREALEAHRVPASCLELEITESALMENLDRARNTLRRIARLGVSLALDDFGTGYSSLAYLKELELHKLKIDKSFVRGLPDDARAAAMARTIVSIAHEFGLTVAAEGVETEAQAAYLEAIGCDLLQGFLLAQPLEAEAVAALLQSSPG
jgi:diguanylate cyclase (GGDEF)-like protein/PAS domain S-box-containing protein